MNVGYIDTLRGSIGEKVINQFEDNNYNTSFILTEKKIHNSKKREIINLGELRKGQFNYKKIYPLDYKIIDKLLPFEKNFLTWIEDTNGFNFSINQRLQFYYDLLDFWNNKILKKKLDLIISFGWPHTTGDYALYLLAKYHYNISFLYLYPFPFFNDDRFIINNTLHDLSKMFTEKDDNKIEEKNEQYPNVLSKYFKLMRSNDARRPDYIDHVSILHEKMEKNFKISLIKTLPKKVLTLNLLNKINLSFKKK